MEDFKKLKNIYPKLFHSEGRLFMLRRQRMKMEMKGNVQVSLSMDELL